MSRRVVQNNEVIRLEAYILGSMLLDWELCQEALRKVSRECFQTPIHRIVLKGIRDIRNKGYRPNVADVWAHLTLKGEDPVLLGNYLHRITDLELDESLFMSSLGWLEVQGICR